MRKKILISIPVAIVIIAVGVIVVANFLMRNLVDERIDEFIAAGYYQSLEYDSLRVQWNGNIEMQDLHVVDTTANEYILEEILISNFDYFHKVPHKMNLSARGLRFPIGIPEFGNAPGNSMNSFMAGVMENDFLPVILEYRYTYSPNDNFQLDNAFRLELPDSFILTTDSVMTDIPLEDLDDVAMGPGTSATQYSMSVQEGKIISAAIALEDLGLVNALMTVQGEAAGVDADEYRQQLWAQIQTMVLFAPQQLQSLAQELAANIGVFLEGDNTLSISIAPDSTGSIRQLQADVMGSFFIGDFEAIATALGLKIESL
jgi:hypothetical protein